MTSIEWTHRPGAKGESWNPIRARHKATGRLGWHCAHASPGCVNCYAERQNKAGARGGTKLAYKPGHEKDIEVFCDEKALLKPLSWRSPRTIFVCSMTDLFGAFVPDAAIDRIFAVAALCPQHTFIVLTKRSDRMRAYIAECGRQLGRQHELRTAIDMLDNVDELANAKARLAVSGAGPMWKPLPNVWLGVSVEDQQRADERVPDLLATPAAVRFVSAEPLLGPVDFNDIPWPADRPRFPATDDISDGRSALRMIEGTRLDWVIVGGESGPKSRPMHPDWARAIRDQCAVASGGEAEGRTGTGNGVAFFFKQWGEWGPGALFVADASARHVYRGEVQTLQIAGSREIKLCIPTRDDDRLGPPLTLERYGKKRAGRSLDGVEHNAWPQVSR